MRRIILGLLAATSMSLAAAAAKPKIDADAPRVERNVIYGMYSGLALLLDVHRPAKPNGFGIVFISGSGFQAGPEYGARPLKENQIDIWGPPLLAAGYTVFAINHRGAPRFHFPAAIEDVQRAIRFVRANAKNYGIAPDKLGGVGGSSGGNLISLAAFRASAGNASDADPVNRESATLQAIVLRAAVTDLRAPTSADNASFIVSYMETPPSAAPAVAALYAAASPVTQISANSPPTLLLHGDSDDLVPFEQSAAMEKGLRGAGVPVELISIPGGEHGADFGSPKPRADWPDYYAATVAWLDRHLRGKPPAK
jgi:acetyl esterase/lipase